MDNGGAGYITPGIRKFVDGLPGLGADNANNLGQFIPVAIPDTTTYPESDYYEIAVVQYREQMHSHLPTTLLGGYVQRSTTRVAGAGVALTNANPDGTETPITGHTGVAPPHYMGMEAFNDTPIVNGTAYPTVTVDPRTYRFRILNAANDRFINLSWYVADASRTEVALNAAEVAAALDDPVIFPTPDETLSSKGPDWIHIGNDSGFLPSPKVIPPQPITWVSDPTVFNAGNVDQHRRRRCVRERTESHYRRSGCI